MYVHYFQKILQRMTRDLLDLDQKSDIQPHDNLNRKVLASFGDYLCTLPQYLLPQHLLSCLLHRLTRIRSRWLKDGFMRWFIRHYEVDMSEPLYAEPSAYPTFNAFFTRALRPETRPIVDGTDTLASPVDGKVSQMGSITDGRIFQAKGRNFALHTLLGGSAELTEAFRGGSFATLYLSPKDYHRVHMPMAGTLRETIHVPGRLFAVNPSAVRVIPNLFARNERVVSIFDTCTGPMALVLVGAFLVGSIETVWVGEITSTSGNRRLARKGASASVALAKGDEMGRFNMGSTVLVLFGPGQVAWAPHILPGHSVHMGELLGHSRISVNCG